MSTREWWVVRFAFWPLRAASKWSSTSIWSATGTVCSHSEYYREEEGLSLYVIQRNNMMSIQVLMRLMGMWYACDFRNAYIIVLRNVNLNERGRHGHRWKILQVGGKSNIVVACGLDSFESGQDVLFNFQHYSETFSSLNCGEFHVAERLVASQKDSPPSSQNRQLFSWRQLLTRDSKGP
jgi:hypothetical protein